MLKPDKIIPETIPIKLFVAANIPISLGVNIFKVIKLVIKPIAVAIIFAIKIFPAFLPDCEKKVCFIFCILKS